MKYLLFLAVTGIGFIVNGGWMILSPNGFVAVYLAVVSSPFPAITFWVIIGVFGCLVILSARHLGGPGAGWISVLGYLGLLKCIVNTSLTVFAPTIIPNLTLTFQDALGRGGAIGAGTINVILGVLVLWYTITRRAGVRDSGFGVGR